MIAVSNINTMVATKLSTNLDQSRLNKSSTDFQEGVTVTISNSAKELQSAPQDGIYDPTSLDIFGKTVDATKLPVQKLRADQFIPATDVAATKQSIRDDFSKSGVYVNDAYVNAFYDAITDINTPIGKVPPNIELPDPPAWWVGHG